MLAGLVEPAASECELVLMFNVLLHKLNALGEDVRSMPRQSYIAFSRRVHFAIAAPSTKARLDLGLQLPGVEPGGRLQPAGSFGSGSISHRVAFTLADQVDEELLAWIEAAYQAAG